MDTNDPPSVELEIEIDELEIEIDEEIEVDEAIENDIINMDEDDNNKEEGVKINQLIIENTIESPSIKNSQRNISIAAKKEKRADTVEEHPSHLKKKRKPAGTKSWADIFVSCKLLLCYHQSLSDPTKDVIRLLYCEPAFFTNFGYTQEDLENGEVNFGDLTGSGTSAEAG
jgi:hypothetical protein